MKPINLSSSTCAKPRSRSSQILTDERAPPPAAKSPRLLLFAQETVSQSVFRNVDLFMLIAEKITNTSTLLHLFEACETARQAAKQLPTSMITALLNTLPLEIRQMAVAILALESIKLGNSAERARFITPETFTPLYVSACMENLEGIEAVRLASNPPYLPLDYDPCSRPCWRWDGDEAKELAYDWEVDPGGDRARSEYLLCLSNTLYPWRFPAHPIEIYRIQRAFWRFELFCRLFPEQSTMDVGNDVELNEDRRRYLARLQIWECEELASVVPFLFRILERIYDPAVFRNQANHVKRSIHQWKLFLAQAPVKGPIGVNTELSDWQNQVSWQNQYEWVKELRFPAHGGIEEDWRLNHTAPHDNILSYDLTSELSHRKWLSHLVSKGLRHMLASHQQYTHDQGEVFSGHYPSQRYEPSLFYNAPIETLLKWFHPLFGYSPSRYPMFRFPPVKDYNLRESTTKHLRQWEDIPEAHLPSRCWDLKRSGSSEYDRLMLREVGYVFWDARSKKES